MFQCVVKGITPGAFCTQEAPELQTATRHEELLLLHLVCHNLVATACWSIHNPI